MVKVGDEYVIKITEIYGVCSDDISDNCFVRIEGFPKLMIGIEELEKLKTLDEKLDEIGV